jgi:hypothetical protein
MISPHTLTWIELVHACRDLANDPDTSLEELRVLRDIMRLINKIAPDDLSQTLAPILN